MVCEVMTQIAALILPYATELFALRQGHPGQGKCSIAPGSMRMMPMAALPLK
jgi:hypothetical protein